VLDLLKTLHIGAMHIQQYPSFWQRALCKAIG